MNDLGSTYRQWVMEQRISGVEPTMVDDDRIRFDLGAVIAHVNFYPYQESEIVELRVVCAADEDTTFFLHFELEDTGLEHAKEIFEQLREAVGDEEKSQTTRILLSCTSAFTTTMFAAKMNEVAQTLKLDYEFEARSIDRALTTDEPFAAIMLAPQAAYVRKQMAEAHPDAIVFEIPGKIFGAYDAAAAIGLLMHALREVDVSMEHKTELRAVRDLSDDCRVLVITILGIHISGDGSARVGWRLYERGVSIAEGALRREKLDFYDIGDLIDMLSIVRIDLSTLDAIAVAVPGIAFRGVVNLPDYGMPFYNIGMDLTHRFGVPVYVDNNCNAAAVGCYVSQDEVENLVFYHHAFGHPSGGMGTVIDGRILKGRLSLAGEPQYFASLFNYAMPDDEVRWSADGLQRMARDVSLAAISIVSPDALYISVDTVDDAEEFRASLAEVLGDVYVPQIHIVGDYIEHVFLGALAMALQKLRDPKYRSHGVGQIPDAFDQEVWQREWELVTRE